MKRILAVLCTGLLALSLSACGFFLVRTPEFARYTLQFEVPEGFELDSSSTNDTQNYTSEDGCSFQVKYYCTKSQEEWREVLEGTAFGDNVSWISTDSGSFGECPYIRINYGVENLYGLDFECFMIFVDAERTYVFQSLYDTERWGQAMEDFISSITPVKK